MTWHKEFLSESRSKNKKNLSTMQGIFSLIEEIFEVDRGRLFGKSKTEIELLKEQFINEKQELNLTLQAIPEISVTELGWTDVRTTGGQKVSGPERQQLGQFLSQIEGANLSEKIASLSAFYENGLEEGYDSLPVGEKIAKVLSYLVFFKALTKVVSNFNAASAGFNFEAFLAVLLDGKQVPANTGTIADFITGDEVPISLKLYAEKSVVVGGSFNDLVGDLVNPQFSGFDGMRYVVCMKSFTSSETGEKTGSGLDIEGDIKFFQFDFTLDNIANIIFDSMDKSKICFQLPTEFIRSGGQVDVSSQLPGVAMPSPQDLENTFIKNFYETAKVEFKQYEIKDYVETFKPFIDALEWSKRDSLFRPVQKGESTLVVRGESVIIGKTRNKEVYDLAYGLADRGLVPMGSAPLSSKDKATKIRKCVVSATDMVNNNFTAAKVKSERAKILKGANFYAPLETSVKFYNNLKDPEMKKRALLNTKGMLETYQFDVNRAQVVKLSDELGTIKIGARIVQEMLNKMTTDLNEAIFDIFTNVKAIQDNTYSFMAGGLQEDEKATASIKAANAIAYKTEELRPDTK